MERRDFLKRLAAAGAAGLAAPACVTERSGAPSSSGGPRTSLMTPDGRLVQVHDETLMHCDAKPASAVRTGMANRRWVMVIDLARCDGCGKCTEACNEMHAIPPQSEWIRVFRMKDSREGVPYFFPKPCFHCDNPPCTRVCPVDATFKRQDGLVLIDADRCIGCRFCMAACPYSTRVFNWGPPDEPPGVTAATYSPECGFPRRVGTVEKCDFCPNMAERGLLPGCATACKMGAIWFGDQLEDAVSNGKGETARLSTLLRDGGYRYLEELGTEPRVYYLPPKDRLYPAPGEEPAGDEEGGRG